MNNISRPRFILSVLLLGFITVLVSLNSDISESFFLDLQTYLSKYLGWMIIILANGFVVFSIFLLFTKYKNIKLGGPEAKPSYSYIKRQYYETELTKEFYRCLSITILTTDNALTSMECKNHIS